jgi:hypothetical protein
MKLTKMARPYISLELRKLVAERADFLCEYCLISASDRVSGCQVDHIISFKHGGATSADNLCYACIFCNLQKGTDLLNTTQSSYSFNHFNHSLDLLWDYGMDYIVNIVLQYKKGHKKSWKNNYYSIKLNKQYKRSNHKRKYSFMVHGRGMMLNQTLIGIY